MPRMAVLILTFNEKRHIAECIKSAAFADEIVVVDSGSSDETRQIAEGLGAKVVTRPMADGFAAQRNFALTQTEADWVMFLDADERITPELAAEIRAVVDKNKPLAYEILRHNYVFRRLLKYGSFRPDYSLRLYPRTAITWTGIVHEAAHVTCPVRRLTAVIIHYTYDDWDRYFAKFNSYTTIMARKMFEENKRVGLAEMLFRSCWGFVRVYFLHSGWRDGRLGLVFSVLHGFYTFVKYIKLDDLNRKAQEK